jgi:hypothetical protein
MQYWDYIEIEYTTEWDNFDDCQYMPSLISKKRETEVKKRDSIRFVLNTVYF